MTDSVYTFKVIVVGAILGCAIGQSYFFQNYRSTPRRINKFYIRQATRKPRIIFASDNGFGFRVTQLPKGVFALRPRTGHPAFRLNPLGSLVGGPSLGSPAKIGVHGHGTVPALTATRQDHQTLVDFLVNVLTQSHNRNIKEKMTIPSVADGPHPMSHTLSEGPHVPTNSLSKGPHVPTNSLSKGSHVLTNTLSKGPNLSTYSVPGGSHVPPIHTSSEGSQFLPTHIHRFQNLGSENAASTVIVHSHGPGQTPHVHIVNLNVSNFPLFPGISRHRHNTIQTSIPNVLQDILPSPLMSDFLDILPHFLTGGNKEEVVTKTVNTTLLQPTKIPIVPVRLQILPASQSTLPARSLTKPVSAHEETEKDEEGDFEGAGDGPINPVTKIPEPNSQIPSPHPEPKLIPTTPMTLFLTTTPTTTPGVLVTTSLIATPVTPVSTPGVPVLSPTTTIEPRATVSPTTSPITPTTTSITPTTTSINPTTTSITPTTTPTTPTTEPIPPIANLTSIS